MLNKELIFEDLSVSKIVNDTSVKIATDIINTFKETEEKYISVSFMVSFKARENTIDYSNEPLFGIVEKLDFTIYDFPNDKEYDDYVKFLNLASQYDTKEKTITINCISINGVIDTELLRFMIKYALSDDFELKQYVKELQKETKIKYNRLLYNRFVL